MRRRLVTLVLALACTGGVAPASTLGCAPQPGLGPACRIAEGWKITLADGTTVITHGHDAVTSLNLPTSHDRLAPACVSDPSRELHGYAIYARAIDSEDRIAQLGDQIVAMVEQANAMLDEEARRGGTTMSYRMRCDADGRVAVANVALPTPIANTTFTTVINDLRALGYASPLAKYWVFFHGRPPGTPGGTGTIEYDRTTYANNRNNWGPSYGVTWGFTGLGGAGIMMHENAHNLGAVQNVSLNSSGAGHCNDGWDVMCYSDGGPRSDYVWNVCSSRRFDCNNDDYFNVDPGPDDVITDHWQLGSPLNRAVAGCSFWTGVLTTSGDGATVAVDPACEDHPFGAYASVPDPPASYDPTISRLAHNFVTADVEVCWYGGPVELRCDRGAGQKLGRVPAGADGARIELTRGMSATAILSII